jgi:hypothetical protein
MENGYTIDELIEELENIKLNLGTGDAEVMLVESSENGERQWNCHICIIETDENENGETIVKIY